MIVLPRLNNSYFQKCPICGGIRCYLYCKCSGHQYLWDVDWWRSLVFPCHRCPRLCHSWMGIQRWRLREWIRGRCQDGWGIRGRCQGGGIRGRCWGIQLYTKEMMVVVFLLFLIFSNFYYYSVSIVLFIFCWWLGLMQWVLENGWLPCFEIICHMSREPRFTTPPLSYTPPFQFPRLYLINYLSDCFT